MAKAVLEFLNYKPNNSSHFSKSGDANTLLANAASKLGTGINNITNKVSSVLESPKSVLGMETRGISDGVIEVQYNPASIRYSGSRPQLSKTEVSQKINGQPYKIVTVTNTSIIDMTFTLVFNSRYPTDTYVRDTMELIMNMLYDDPTKKARFSWANMVAQGKVTRFTGKYDMFDATGNPTSGSLEMTINMSVSDGNVSAYLDEENIEKQRKKLSKAEGE